MLKKQTKYILAILILGFILRVVGLDFGFPFIFHPDEPAVIRSALGIRFNPNPEHFDWPHLYFYLNNFVFLSFAAFRNTLETLGLKAFISNLFPLVWNDELVFYLLSRFLSAVLGTLTLIPVYLSAKSLFKNEKVGLLSALILAILPLHVKNSHYALIDVPMMFFLAWAMYFCVLIYLTGKLKNYMLAGFFVGLAASTKYNGGFGAFVIMLAYLMRLYESKKFNFSEFVSLTLSGLILLLGFLLGTPYALLDYETFLRTDSAKGALWQFTNVGKVSFPVQLSQFFRALTYGLANDFGYTILPIFSAAFILWITQLKRKKNNSVKQDNNLFKLSLVLIPGMVFLFYVSGFEKNRSHYYLIAYPFIVVSVGYFLAWLSEMFLANKPIKYLTIFILLVPFTFSIIADLTLIRADSRIILYRWLQASLMPTDYIVYDSTSLKPVIDKFTNAKQKGFDSPVFLTKSGYYIMTLDANNLAKYKSLNEIHVATVTFKEFKIIEPSFMNGPNILIFSFGKPASVRETL